VPTIGKLCTRCRSSNVLHAMLLSDIGFAKPFRPPTRYEVLRFRYSSYLGEKHPAAKKVVMTFTIRQLRQALSSDSRFDDAWEHKFKLLCGTRYNQEKDEVRMSSEQFPYPAQNKRWLSDKLDEMIEAATVVLDFDKVDIRLEIHSKTSPSTTVTSERNGSTKYPRIGSN